MSITSKLGGVLKAQPKFLAPAAPAIERQLRAAETELSTIEGEYEDIALAVVLGEEDATKRLAEWQDRAAAKRQHVTNLGAAHRAAMRRDAANEQRAKASLAEAQLRAIEQHLAARDKAAVELAVAIENAASAYHRLLKRSEKARAACPHTMAMGWPGGSMCSLAELREAVANEMWRLGAGPAAPGNIAYPRAFPGAKPASAASNDPAAIPHLSGLIKEASAHTLDVLKGRKAANSEPGVAQALATPQPTRSAEEIMATIPKQRLTI